MGGQTEDSTKHAFSSRVLDAMFTTLLKSPF